jgi:DNA modification methylase
VAVRILIGDVRERLREMDADSFDCVVTSPPYWGLRDYDVDGQIGLERTLGEHLDVMVEVFQEVRRVLKPTGTLWLNYGDCYATQPNGRKAADIVGDDRAFRDKPFSTIGPIRAGKSENKGNTASDGLRRNRAGGYLKPKDLCMIPNRLAIALQEDGWWVRSEIIWHKPNPMPESTKDRPTNSHEKIWLLSKAERYWFDADAISEPAKWAGDPRNGEGRLTYDGKRQGADGKGQEAFVSISDTRNCRNVWQISTSPFPEAHFATFPPELAERCIKAGCPPSGTVLDPFGGAGTTGLVADRLGRNAVLIELNPDYADIARRRIHGDAPMFSSVETVRA